MNEIFAIFVSLMTYLGYIFLLDVPICTITDDEREEKRGLRDWGILHKVEEKVLEIHKHCWFLIT